MAGQGRVDTTGSSTSASASTLLRLTLSGLDEGATYTTPWVDVGDLKLLCFWMRKTASGSNSGMSVTPQFAVASTNTGTAVTLEPLDLAAALAVGFNTVQILNYTFPAKFVRLSITNNAGGGGVGTETVQLVYGGSQ